MNISEIGEFGLIAGIASRFGDLVPQGCRGIGDDCAVIPLGDGQCIVITTDMLVEDIHFIRNKITPYELGYKSLAVNLSDIAAMGGSAHSTFLSLSLPKGLPTQWCDDFFAGYRAHGVALLGGDTTKSTDKIVINVTAVGMMHIGNIKLRSGAKVTDKIYVTSTLGDSVAGLRAILNDCQTEFAELVHCHNFPRAHIKEGLALSKNSQVTSMMDISDGLASDLKHILKASAVGADIELSQIPLSDQIRNSAWNARELALTGGEDYCLLFTATADFIPTYDFPCYLIGTVTNAHIGNIHWFENGERVELDYKGFTHF